MALGIEGAILGHLLDEGSISPLETGQYIRDTLSKDSAAANYWTNPWNPYAYPLVPSRP